MSGRHIASLALALLTASPHQAAFAANGWRYDGSAVREDARPPMIWDDAHRVWTAPLPSWSNATPVLVGSTLVVGSEPTTLLGLEASSGRVLWRVANDYIDTLPAADRPAFQARVDAIPGLKQALAEAVAEVGRLRKLSRSADAPADTSQRITAFTAVMEALKGQLDGLAPYLTPPDKEIIGYSSPTPATDGARIYALFGHGVVSAVSTSGKKLWTTWAGAAVQPMRGYNLGSVASPLLADGVLIIAHNHLQGLDPATGKVLWRGQPWPHYGTPAVVELGGASFVLTPDGKAIRARDGVVVAQGMADLWYAGPVASGDLAIWAGATGADSGPERARAAAWRLTPDGAGGLVTSRLWERAVVDSRVYSPGVLHHGVLYVTDRYGNFFLIDANTGADIGSFTAKPHLMGPVFASAMIAGPHFIVAAENGAVAFGTTGPTWTFEALAKAGATMRTMPLFVGDKAYVRTQSGVACYTSAGQ